MHYVGRLKPDRSITGLLPAIFTLTALGVILAAFGPRAALAFGSFAFFAFAGLAFVAYARTRAIGYLASTFYLLCVGLAAAVVPRIGILQLNLSQPSMVFIVLSWFFGLWLVHLVATRKYKWRGREILELAASTVRDLGNGFTQRPRPAGSADCSWEEIAAFSRFALRNQIAIPFTEPDRILLVPVMMGREFRYLFSLNLDPSGDTWVAFDADGNVSVNISERDYLSYKDDLSFDQLCESLADLFVEFLELFRRGRGERIIDRMDALRVPVLS